MVQGTGADIAKIAMLNLHRMGFEIHAMLHDGFLISVPDDEVDYDVSKIKAAMEMKLNGLKLTVSIKVGKSWGDCK